MLTKSHWKWVWSQAYVHLKHTQVTRHNVRYVRIISFVYQFLVLIWIQVIKEAQERYFQQVLIYILYFFLYHFPEGQFLILFYFILLLFFFSPETKGLGIWGILMCVKQTLLTKKERRTQSFQHNSLCSTTGC